MDKYFGYLRVSTTKQGEGVSLDEQKDAISAFAQKNGFSITQWYEEKVTAAKKGRKEFRAMIKSLRAGNASGVVIHKIDRSARNLSDWAEFSNLTEEGFDIRFVSGDLNLRDRSSRLSADLQAVIAADYIRNLQEEVRKGFYGRLKQGLYPLSAPVGYINNGCGGKVKTQDPQKARLIKQAFELYATGEYSLSLISEEMYQRGLLNTVGNKIDKNGWYRIFKNPFYAGLILVHSTGEVFPGIHEPIVSVKLFEKVQKIKANKFVRGNAKHNYLYRRLFTCAYCSRSLVAEKQKGRVYYRCHTKECNTKTIREDQLDSLIESALQPLQISETESHQLAKVIESLLEERGVQNDSIKQSLHLKLNLVANRIKRLGDALLDGSFDKEEYAKRKKPLLAEELNLKQEIASFSQKITPYELKVRKNLELLKSLSLSYFSALDQEKTILIKNVTSNRKVSGENASIELKTPFRELVEKLGVSPCWGDSDRTRTKKESQKRCEKIAYILLAHADNEMRRIKDPPIG